MLHQLRVRGDSRPRAERVLCLLVLVFRVRVRRFRRVVALAQVYQMRCAANVSGRPVFQAQLAHLPAQLTLECALCRRHDGRCNRTNRVIFVVFAVLLRYDSLCNGVQALACPYLVYEVGDFFFRVVQDSLDKRLEGGITRLEVVDVLLVDAFAAVVRIRVVDARRVVDGGTCRAGGSGTVALCGRLATALVQGAWFRGGW